MKKLILVLLICTTSFQSFGQDPLLLETDWYLIQLVIDGDEIYPPVNEELPFVRLSMADDGSIFEFDSPVCNSFSGMVDYDPIEPAFTTKLYQTFIDCEYLESKQFKNIYFWHYFLNDEFPFYYEIIDDGNGGLQLTITGNDGNYAVYGNSILEVSDEVYSGLNLFPNPVSETLFIQSEGTAIESLAIYSVTGQLVLSEKDNTNAIDVSNLDAGLYFVEVSTSEGKSIQRFIKK